MVITPAYYRRWAVRFAQMARRAPDDHTAEELAQIAARLRALAKHSADQRIKRSYLLERARFDGPSAKAIGGAARCERRLSIGVFDRSMFLNRVRQVCRSDI